MNEDEYGEKKAADWLGKIPEGCVEIYEDYSAVVTRPVSQFEPDPDARAQSLMAWVEEEVGRAVAGIRNYETAPVESLSEVTCPRNFIQRRVESRRLIRPRAWGEQQAIGGAGPGCAADRL
ncbi:hypothetical protein, partial [Methylosinus sp. R-45379]|uniref:hypothetical protein n=1 Tax=Methylosinus sp. R-45379 TaxID=980563 RepID=UPI001AEC988D